MPGPVPKPAEARARRNGGAVFIQLPAEGRQGRTPPWPLPLDVVLTAQLEHARRLADEAWSGIDDEDLTKTERASKKRSGEKYDLQVAILEEKVRVQTAQEKKVWRDLWRTPQATQWEHLAWFREVAQYVRHKVRAELGSIEDAREARMQADRLGLTPKAMLALRWQIAARPESDAEGGPRGRAGSRERFGHLKVVASAG